MQTLSNPIELKPSIAEQRRAVTIPACDGASETLKREFDVLQARSDALEADRSHAAQHRADFARELEEMTETIAVVKDDPAGIVGIVEDKSITWEATTVRDIAIGLLRKELSIRGDLTGYLERWQVEGRKLVGTLRGKLEETREGVTAWLIKGHSKFGGFHDPKTCKLSPSRVLPGYINSHPAVLAATAELKAAEGPPKTKPVPVNAREMEELRRLIRSEAARLAGLSVG
jgi:hypothetical protein